MTYEYQSGPVVHMGVSLALARLLKLNPVVTVFCGILPDLVDKPLAALGSGGGRYIGHTLLVLGLVTLAFALWQRKHGRAALVGGMSHLLLDLNALIPWFYPFKEYDFYVERLDFATWVEEYLTFAGLTSELLLLALAGSVVFAFPWLYRRHANRHSSG